MARRIVVELLGDSKSLERSFKKSATAGKKWEAQISGLGRSIIAPIAGATGAFVGLTQVITRGFDEMRESRKVAAQTNAVLESTGQIAGVTAEHVEELGQQLLKTTGIDDELIKSAENLLLTFTNVRNVIGDNNDIFDQATRATLDMSVAMGEDLQSAVIRVGKALQDPIRGVTALRRVGVLLTEQQEKQIRQLVRSGKLMQAQKIILRELQTEFGGSAQAAEQASGGLDRLDQTITNFLGMLAEKFMPMIEDATTALQQWFDEPKNIDKVATDVEELARAFAGFAQGAKEANDKGNRFMDRLRTGITAAAEGTRVGIMGALGTLPTPIQEWARREKEESLRELRELVHGVDEAGHDMNAALSEHLALIKGRARAAAAAGGGAAPPTAGAATGGGAGVTAAQRNQWFDAKIARQLNRLQDLSLQKQLAGLRVIARQLRERIAATKDVTRRLNLEDDLLGVMREQRSVQQQITDSIKAGNELLKDRAEAIKSAIIDRLQRRQTDILNKRALEDAREQLRIARQIGGPMGIRQALRDLQDVRFDILSARLEAAPATLTAGGRFALGGVVTINVNGVTDPNAVAIKVAEVLKKRDRRSASPTRGPAAGATTGVG